MKSKLYIVATPIGNLEDITLRALKILARADVILTERKTTILKLLNRYKIKPARLITYREDTHEKLAPLIKSLFRKGSKIVLVSEAGTPGIADPGLKLVKLALEGGVDVVPIPGPSSVTAALSVLPLSTPKFIFLGFAPVRCLKLKKQLEDLQQPMLRHKFNIVYFLGKRNLRKMAKCLKEALFVQKVWLVRELTKIHEEIKNLTPEQLYDVLIQEPKGELILVIPYDEKLNS